MNGLNLIICALQLATPRLEPAQPGDRYVEYYHPIFAQHYATNHVGWVTTNNVTNFNGGWNAYHRIVLRWAGHVGSNYVVESSPGPISRPVPGPTNQGWTGAGRWLPCSLPLPGASNMGWTSGVPSHIRFFRLRAL